MDVKFSSPNSKGLVFSAVYNSRSVEMGTMGFGWHHTYSLSLETDYAHFGKVLIKIVDETGRSVFFSEDTAGIYKGVFQEKTHIADKAGEFVWYRLDGSSRGFTHDGRLNWIKDEKGNRINLFYDSLGSLETVTDLSSGRMLIFGYNTEGLIASIKGPVTESVSDGIWVRFNYDVNYNLSDVIYADGSGYKYAYTDARDLHNLSEKRNRAGHLINTWSYDDQDRCIEFFSRRGKSFTIAYPDNVHVNVSDAYGILRSYTIGYFNGRRRLLSMAGPTLPPYSKDNVVRWDYDESLNLTEVEYGGGTVDIFMDHCPLGKPKIIIFAAGSPVEREVNYSYHPNMTSLLRQVEASVLGNGNKETIWDYDNDGNSIPNENPSRFISRIIEKGFTHNQSGAIIPFEYITRVNHNLAGQLISIDGPLPGSGDERTFSYEEVTGNLSAITEPLIGPTLFSNYDAAGQLGSITNVNDQTNHIGYDARGRQTTVTHEADNSTKSVIYNSAGLPATTVDEDGVSREFEYDPTYGRLSYKFDMNDNFIAYTYDAQGNLIEKAKHDTYGVRFSRKRWSYQHPIYPGKLWKRINSDDSYTEYAYDDAGNIVSVKSPENHNTFYHYDAHARIVAIDHPDNTSIGYGYDKQGNLISITDGIGNKTTFVYDDLGRLLMNFSPDTGVTTYTYDENGNMIQKTDAKGITAQHLYDDLSRLINVYYPDPSQNINFTYDTGSNSKGRLSTIADESGSTSYEYCSRGRLVGKDSTIEGMNYSLTRRFSPGGRLIELVYPSGRRTDVTLNPNGRKSSVSTTLFDNTVVLVSNLEYQPFGRPRSLNTSSGGSVAIVSGDCECMEISNPGTLFEQLYSYDANRNLISINGTNSPWHNQAFAYDNRNRLVDAHGSYGEHLYLYDGAGNRLNRTVNGRVETYSYDPGTNRLESILTDESHIDFDYDANGNVTRIGNKNLYYNQNNRLIRAVEDSTIKGEYVYNALGQRVSKKIGDSVTVFHYDFDGNIISEGMPDGSIILDYLYLGESRVAMVDNSNERIYYFLHDHLGTPQMVTDSQNTIVWEASYKPFGEAVVNPKSTVQNNFRFPGQYYDQETGLHYNYHRYYDPKIGRYLRPDPIGLAGGLNLYTYAENNPVNAFDPFGLELVSVPGGSQWWDMSNLPSQSLPGFNYCGPGNNSLDPTCPLDQACKDHDECYESFGLSSVDVNFFDRGQDEGPSSQDYCDDNLCQKAASSKGWIKIGINWMFCD